MMRLRFSLCTVILAAGLIAGPAQAQQSPQKDHLSYYTYYKTTTGETVTGVATKFGLAETSLVRMNPYLTQYGTDLPSGTLVCVPKEGSQVSTGLLARSERIARTKAKAEEDATALAAAEAAETSKAAKSAGKAKKKTASTSKVKEESEYPDEAEWAKLAEMATKGTPAPPERAAMIIEAPPSKMIRGNGEVIWIPAAKPKPMPKRVAFVDTSRGQLTSRKGKAIHTLIVTGRSFMGVPYVWGGEDPSGFDCSGFIQYVYAKHGINLPRTADIQFDVGKVVKRGDEKPGDLVFFETYCPGPSHVGIYLGRDCFLHASSSRGVTVDRLSSDFFGQRYLGAKRNF